MLVRVQVPPSAPFSNQAPFPRSARVAPAGRVKSRLRTDITNKGILPDELQAPRVLARTGES